MKKNLYKFLIISFIFVLAIGASGINTAANLASADFSTSSQDEVETIADPQPTLEYKIFDRANNEIDKTDGEHDSHPAYGDQTYRSFKWESANYIELSFNYVTTSSLPNDRSYKYSYSLVYYQRYTGAFESFENVIDTVDSKENDSESDSNPQTRPEAIHIEGILPNGVEEGENVVTDLTKIPSLTFYIKDDITEQEQEALLKDHPEYANRISFGDGWGIYSFSIDLQEVGGEETSALPAFDAELIYISPLKLTANDRAYLAVDPKEDTSKSALGGAYNFTVYRTQYGSLVERLKYIDMYCIKWYVEGETFDGTKYKLELSDITKTDEINGVDFIYENYRTSRLGSTFYLDLSIDKVRGLGGKWNVYFQAFDPEIPQDEYAPDYDPNAPGDLLFQSSVSTIRTGSSVRTDILIWILIALSVVVLLVIIFLVINAIRKEKVW